MQNRHTRRRRLENIHAFTVTRQHTVYVTFYETANSEHMLTIVLSDSMTKEGYFQIHLFNYEGFQRK